MTALPPLGGISFVEYQSQRGRDEALLRSLCRDLQAGRLPGNSTYYAKVLERHLTDDYPPLPKNRQRSRAAYWIAALYWLLRDDGNTLAANMVASWCREHGVDRKAQSVLRAARTAAGRRARERIAKSVEGHAQFDPRSVISAHRIAIEERILAWHTKDDAFGVVRVIPASRSSG